MAGWADDPELLATFRAEVDERLLSWQAGLLTLESHPDPRQLVAGLFRDAHTIKGSARMLGMDGILKIAHSSEDLLGALRDGRLPVRRPLIDLMLAACDGIAGALPDAADPLPAEYLEALSAAIARAAAGDDSVPVPQRPTSLVEEAGEAPALASADSMRVATSRVYDLLDVVGEAQLDVRRLGRAGSTVVQLSQELTRRLRALRDGESTSPGDLALSLRGVAAIEDQLTAAVRELRERNDVADGRLATVRDSAMGLAMVPVRRIAAGLPRVVRMVADAAGKDVRLVVTGEDVELDKQVLDGVSDALKHLVVNAVDHGCEPRDVRRAAGKPAQATVTVAARAAGGTVVIDVCDDGAGIDDAQLRDAAIRRGLLPADSTASGSTLYDVLFMPAFSTAAVVTESSGRGVGLDVVRTAVDSLGGSVELRTEPGRGTTFTLTLPVTLGVLHCLMARVGPERYALPIPGVVESLSLRDTQVHTLAGQPVVMRHGATVPLRDLAGALGVPGRSEPTAAVVVRQGDRQVAWSVDALEGERELVVKNLGGFLGRLPVVSGATIDGDGSVLCLVDLRDLTDIAAGAAASRGGEHRSTFTPAPRLDPDEPAVQRPRVLVVEDSVGVRELERSILEAAGYDVVTAVDGADGAARLADEPADLVLSDVEMPGMDGFALTRAIRRTQGWEQVPVVIMTGRRSEDDQRAGLEAGASAYLLKTEFDQAQLVETVRRLVGR